jgi:hypothetical protein
MSAKNLRALAIRSGSNLPGTVEHKWDHIPSIQDFTKNIIIPELGVDKDGTSKVDIGNLVSGMPTVFARANLFRNAIEQVNDRNAELSGLMLFYKSLLDEWRGIIACIALSYKDLKIERIRLQYSDGKDVTATANPYEPLGAFGNMLFERKPLWCDQNTSVNDQQIPFIDVISYKDIVVGATSPDTLLFTSVSYRMSERQAFVNINNGRFIDPLKSEMKPQDLVVLYAFVKSILDKLNDFTAVYSSLPDYLKPSFGVISGNLSSWLAEMRQYAVKHGWSEESLQAGSPPEVACFLAPFSRVFNHSTELFGLDGVVSSENREGAVQFNPKELLLPESATIAQIRFERAAETDPTFLAKKPLILLRATIKNSPDTFEYFALPLSPLALQVFGNNLASVVGISEGTEVRSRLTAEYDEQEMRLHVKLRLHTTMGNESEINRIYKVGTEEIVGRDVLLWPNFISKKWKRYFLYNEIPHNDVKFQVTPFVGNMYDGRFSIITDSANVPFYLVSDGRVAKLPDQIQASIAVECNTKVSDNPYKYEIYESNAPFKGLKFSFGKSDNVCGFAVIRYDRTNSQATLPKDNLSDDRTLNSALLGVDFGSTNSSIAYWSERDNQINDMVLRNRRISLLSTDNKDNNERAAIEDEVFFFQNDEIPTNAIKSILAVHDYKRVANPQSLSQDQLLEKEVFGGFPCFEKNLPIENSDAHKVMLSFNRAGLSELKHNMKWTGGSIEKSHKKAYLRSLMLHIYAQLFEEGHEPTSLKWSYPSSMPTSLLNEYWDIYNSLKQVSPIVDSKELVIYPPSDLSQLAVASGSSWDTGGVGGSSWGTISGDVGLSDESWGSSSNAGAWGATQSANSTGSANPSPSGWGDSNSSSQRSVNPEIAIDKGPVSFSFKPLNHEESLTESSAVANYFLKDHPVRPGELLMIFDVGGSTTDISVLAQMPGPDGQPGKAMIKQNSIRWAAQRLAQATRHSKNFQSVLLRMCESKKIRIQGLNNGPLKYSENTAPFYYEQLIDRLQGSDFQEFYRLIAAECKELMSVNLYITGLIMYYAGQLAFKLRQEILRARDVPEYVKNRPPQIHIAFAGKGARMFDWFEAINPRASQDYYTQMFIRGIGGMEVAKQTITPIGNPHPIININAYKRENNSDVKYEVSKGLAIPTYDSKILVQKEKQAIEILGEEGFCVYQPNGDMQYLDFSNSVTPDMMEHLGSLFVSNPEPGRPPCPRFMDFADLFYKVSTSMFGFTMKPDDFVSGFNNMNIESFIRQDPDYIEAQKRRSDKQKFDYIAPVFIMEGMKFYEERIMKALRS